MPMLFTSVDNILDMGNTLNFERTDPFSLSAWVNYSGAGNYTIAAKIDPGGDRPGWTWSIISNVPYFALVNIVLVNWIEVTGVTAVTASTWVHLVLTYSGSSTAAGVKMYMNGVENTYTVSADTLSASALTAVSRSVGARNVAAPASQEFNGIIDNCQIYNRALSLGEIVSLYTLRGKDSNFNGLVSRLRLDEQAAGTAAAGAGQQKDVSFNQFNGTPINSPVYAGGAIGRRKAAS